MRNFGMKITRAWKDSYSVWECLTDAMSCLRQSSRLVIIATPSSLFQDGPDMVQTWQATLVMSL